MYMLPWNLEVFLLANEHIKRSLKIPRNSEFFLKM